MKMKVPVFFLVAVMAISIPSFGRSLYDKTSKLQRVEKITASEPYITVGVHNIGKIGLTVSNQGHFGNGYIPGVSNPIDGGPAPSCIYPFPGILNYLFAGAFWIGAVVGRDTLVSVGADGWGGTEELYPDPYPRGRIIHRTITNPNDLDAISEQDFVAIYTDTLTNPLLVDADPIDNRPHMPLHAEITQRSYAWSYEYAEDFVLFDYDIKNIGDRTLRGVYMGFYVDGDVTNTPGGSDGYQDDICGFRREIPSPFGCGFIDTINIAYIADNDGKQYDNDPCPYDPVRYPTSVTGIRVVRTPSDSLKYSFNWWISNGDPAKDFGPRKAGTPDDPFRPFGAHLGTPEGDRVKYYIMRHEEFDYDQLFSARNNTGEGWLPPPEGAPDFADGFDTRYLLSFGPFDIDPGEVLPISFAYVAGQDFHVDCNAFKNTFDPYFPEAYYNKLNFQDFGLNSLWASWIYDNPGYDTDGDGYKGKYRVCVYDSIPDTLGKPIVGSGVAKISADTVIIEDGWIKFAEISYYEGDGIPDFRGATPPPAPRLRIFPSVDEFNRGQLRIRWNGHELGTETTEDVFSGIIDFEGYRVYQSLSSRASDFVLQASYDLEDYDKHIWEWRLSKFVIKDIPYTLDSLRQLYGPAFEPLAYSRDYPFRWGDSVFFFTRKDWNMTELRDTMMIHKVYPDEPFPCSLHPDSAKKYCPDALVEDTLFKYFEYEYTIRNLLPSQLYYASVTAFDFGSPSGGLASLESSPSLNMVAEYPLNNSAKIESEGLKVVVFPNPYRLDANYRRVEGGGFEGRGLEDYPDDRVRRIHFANLPPKCKIRIFTLDGDLVREIDHDKVPGSPQSMVADWDLITRNTQAVVSGIYYWVVESPYGNQMGKLVIIM